MQVLATVITSSPALIPTARSASSIASVPEATPIACSAPTQDGELPLEPLDRLAADEAAGVEHLGDGGVELRPQRSNVAREIEERDARHAQYASPCSR